MTPAERVARLKQLYDQVKALNDEIARLEAEDEQFVAHRQRSLAAKRQPISYADYVRYSAYREQLEVAWAQAGRPRDWSQLALLVRLRDVLLISSADDVAVAGAPASPTASVARPTAPVSNAAGAPAAAVARPAVGQRPSPTVPSSPPSVGQATPAVPTPAARAPAAAPAPAASTRPAATAAPTAGSPSPTSPAPSPPARSTAAAPQVSHSQLVEMHSPILNEVGDLTKRAEDEFRTGQTGNGLASLERATYLLERVAHAPNAMSQRLIKVLDEGLKEGAVADADRTRREQVRARVTAVLEISQ